MNNKKMHKIMREQAIEDEQYDIEAQQRKIDDEESSKGCVVIIAGSIIILIITSIISAWSDFIHH